MSDTIPLHRLPAYDEDRGLTVVIETPKGSRNKYAYDEAVGAFRLKGFLPEGTSFPYDFGFIPSTKGEDGDPIDILLILDSPAFPGCLVTGRLIGAIQAEQREADGACARNDRLIGVAAHAKAHDHVRSLDDLPRPTVSEIEAFFEHYNRLHGTEFRPLGRCGPETARDLVEKGRAAFRDR